MGKVFVKKKKHIFWLTGTEKTVPDEGRVDRTIKNNGKREGLWRLYFFFSTLKLWFSIFVYMNISVLF